MVRLKILVVLFYVTSCQMLAQIHSHEAIDAANVGAPELDVDPNGAVGTKQYMEWTNVYYQAYNKKTLAPVWSTPQVGTQPWQTNGTQNCNSISGDGVII